MSRRGSYDFEMFSSINFALGKWNKTTDETCLSLTPNSGLGQYRRMGGGGGGGYLK